MNEYQEKPKSQANPQIQSLITNTRSASSSNPVEEYSPKPMHGMSLSKIPLNAPTQEEADRDRKELDRNAQRDKFLKDYPEAAKMLKSIKIGENDKESLETLKKEFMKSGFTYSMAPKSPDKFLSGAKEGDCSTLAKAYVKIAKEYLGIENVKIGYKSGDFFVPNGGKVLDQNNATGNVDNGQHWVFTNHYWVQSPIGTIDLLFLGQEVNQSKWIDKTGEGNEDGIEYRTFGDYKVYDSNFMSANLEDKYATNIDEAEMGKKKAEAALIPTNARQPSWLERLVHVFK
jgi:hypothetical protein